MLNNDVNYTYVVTHWLFLNSMQLYQLHLKLLAIRWKSS